MPIFRIMGGNNNGACGAPRSALTNVNPAATPPPSQLQQLQQQQLQQQQQQQAQLEQQQRASRYTYPGHRLTASQPTVSNIAGLPPHAATSMGTSLPSQPARTGGTMTRGPGGLSPAHQLRLAQQQQQQQQQVSPAVPPNPVILGNQVGSASNPGPSPLPNSAVSVETSRPGAYAVTRTSTGPAQIYRVTVPPGVRPGSEFTVHAGPRRVRVRCPPTSRPGHSLQITLPPEPVTHNLLLKMAPLTSTTGEEGGGAVPMTAEVRKVNQAASENGGTAQTFLVTIPPNVYPGMQFTVNVNGQRFMVTCPSNAGPNMKVRIVPPTQREEPMAAPKTQVFEVTVPAGVRPNQPFTLMANGQRVLVTCPPNVVEGQKIRFQLPVQQVIGNIQLSYDNSTGGWIRTIRVTDLKFQWVRVNKKKEEEDTANVDVDGMNHFDFSKAAYVRKINFLEGNDARMRTGTVELVPANEAVVESRLVYHNRTLLSYADIANVQGKPLEEKIQWFSNICNQLTSSWEEGHVKIVVRRHQLLNDSVDAVMSLGREDLRKRWRIEFLGEPGIDAGGVTREWFQLVTEQIFDPDFGLWLSSMNNQMCMTINPASRKYSTDMIRTCS